MKRQQQHETKRASSTARNRLPCLSASCLLIIAALLLALPPSANAFLVVTPASPVVSYYGGPARQPCADQKNTVLFAKGRKKESMAAKRKRRAQATQKKQAAMEAAKAERPASTLDFKSPPKPPTPTLSGEASKEEGREAEPTQKAKELVAAQQESVKMLTHVSNCIQQNIDMEALSSDLSTRGYHVVDGFLDHPDIVDALEHESQALYQTHNDMVVDVQQLGTGEFMAALEGGDDQYPKCPRSIELIVSLTSKLSARLNKELDNNHLDDRACSRAMARLFDRSALKASLQLLLGSNDEDNIDHALEEQLTPPPFQTVIEKDKKDNNDTNQENDDLRKISICYFAVPTDWNYAACGGGISFSTNDSSHDLVEAKRDRLVLWKSDTTLCRREPFRGNDEMPLASSLELHLVETNN